jgi:hypothetical protein
VEAPDPARTLDVVVRRTPEEEPDSVFLLARGVAFIGFFTGSMTMCVRGTPSHPVLGALAFAVAMLAAWFSTKAPPRRMKLATRRMPVTIGADAIAFDGKTIPRARVASTLFSPGNERDPASVRCLDDAGRILFEAVVDDETAGSELIRAIGRDATRNRTSYLTASPFGLSPNRRLAMIFGGYGLVGAFLFLAPKMSPLLFLPLVFTLFVLPRMLMSLAGRIEVGADGLLLRWLGLKRFIPYERIEHVEASGSFVRITTKEGRGATVYPLADAIGLDALIARIEAARRTRMLPTPRAELEARLDRGERTVEEWRRHLASLEDHDGYREAALPRDELWRIVEDPSAPEAARLGAALVLRRIDGASPASPMLRVAADAVASPKLRVALETAADPEIDDEELERKLTALR